MRSPVRQCRGLRLIPIARFRANSAAYGVLRFVMESGAKGCEVVISGKLRAARAKSMKFTDGFMIHSGQPARDFVDEAVRHVMLRQGVLGIKVKMCVPLSILSFFPAVLALEGLLRCADIVL